MNPYVQVYILDAVFGSDKRYTYFVLPEQRAALRVGGLVLVPFGNGNRQMLAVVAGFSSSSEYKNLKTVITPVDSPAEIDEDTVELCQFIKSRAFCTFGAALRAVLPRGLSVMTEEVYSPGDVRREADGLEGEIAEYILASDRDEITRRELHSRFGDESAAALVRLVSDGIIRKRVRVVYRNNEKTVKTVSPALGEAELSEYLDGSRRTGSKKRLELLFALAEHGTLTLNELADAYGISAQVVNGAQKEGLVTVGVRRVSRTPYGEKECPPPEEKPLTVLQQAAVDTLFPLVDSPSAHAALLYGVTGSGKTRVIIECVKRALENGKSAIVLIPEIGLTSQAVDKYRAVFGEKLSVVHSMLSDGERADAYRAAYNGEVSVVIGTRSAVFAPLKNLGIIAVDEEQEHTYKSEMTPRYHARDIARFRCSRDGALMLLASATPSVESYYKAQNGVYTLVTMDRRATDAALPEVVISDVRGDERVRNMRLIGTPLAEKMRETVSSGKQAILFVNRRGYNSFASCQDCGNVIVCPNCSVSLTHHVYSGDYRRCEKLVCHYCGYTVPVPDRCDSCGGKHIGFFGFGTQKLQEELERDFPHIRSQRMDTDTTGAKFSHDELLGRFSSGEKDVLFGTQMVAKGLDFPLVGLVGVVNADTLLYMDDFRAGERTFSLITQLIGRAGRASGGRGLAIIQTSNPDNEILRKAAAQDYDEFYRSEIVLRKSVLFPPFCDLAVLVLSGLDEFALLEFAKLIASVSQKMERSNPPDARVIRLGPFRQAVYKLNGKYRQRIVYKYKDNRFSREFLAKLLAETLKITPPTISAELDINPSAI